MLFIQEFEVKIQSAIDLLKVKLAENKKGENYIISLFTMLYVRNKVATRLGQAHVAHNVVMPW